MSTFGGLYHSRLHLKLNIKLNAIDPPYNQPTSCYFNNTKPYKAVTYSQAIKP